MCKEENIAAELNLKLTKVQRKLWINPFKFQQPEDLTQFNTKMLLTYLKPKTIIVTRMIFFYWNCNGVTFHWVNRKSDPQ